MSLIVTATQTLEAITCAQCGMLFAMPTKITEQFRDNHEFFSCPFGHKQHFPHQSEQERLRGELKRKEQELADRVQSELLLKQQLNTATRSAKIAKGRLNRVKNGKCPCCKELFPDLHHHMQEKHPDFHAGK